jgi:hypothetical protein
VRIAVVDKTKGDQVPWTEDGIQRRQRVLFGGEAKAPPSSQAGPMRPSEAAEAWSAVKDATSPAALEAYITRFKNTFYADLARQRIEELKKQAVSPPALSADKPARKNEAPTVSGMLRCESYPERTACELNTNCSWADNRKQCEQKSGGLATAMLEALPPSKPASQAPCQGIEALVGNEKRCLKPGTGKSEHIKDCASCPEMVVVPSGRFTMGSPRDEWGRDA